MFREKRLWRWVTALLCVVALVLCVIMVVHSLTGTRLVGCSAGSSCDAVLGSRWSLLFGVIPISGMAAGVWLAMLVCSAHMLFADGKDVELDDMVSTVMLMLAGAVTGSAIWFTVLQVWAIQEFCPYCMSAHLTGIIVSLILLSAPDAGHKARKFAIGLTAAAVLAGLQLVTTPRSAFIKGSAGEPLAEIQIGDAPITGSEDARMVVTLLFDYQCSHCRKLHSMLPDVVEQSGGKLAFLLCPTPLSVSCNPYIPASGDDPFKGSCELARLALAVWYAAPELFEEYDAWLFSSEQPGGWRPRPVDEARMYASELLERVSVDLENALGDSRIDSALALHVELLGRTAQGGSGGIPRMIYGQRWITPEADNAASLLSDIQTVFEESPE